MSRSGPSNHMKSDLGTEHCLPRCLTEVPMVLDKLDCLFQGRGNLGAVAIMIDEEQRDHPLSTTDILCHSMSCKSEPVRIFFILCLP